LSHDDGLNVTDLRFLISKGGQFLFSLSQKKKKKKKKKKADKHLQTSDLNSNFTCTFIGVNGICLHAEADTRYMVARAVINHAIKV
jgi:hypothetical protein